MPDKFELSALQHFFHYSQKMNYKLVIIFNTVSSISEVFRPKGGVGKCLTKAYEAIVLFHSVLCGVTVTGKVLEN